MTLCILAYTSNLHALHMIQKVTAKHNPAWMKTHQRLLWLAHCVRLRQISFNLYAKD